MTFMRTTLLLFVFGTILSACVPVSSLGPAVRGTTATNPIDYVEQGFASVVAGQQWYLETFLSPQDLGYSLEDRNDALEFTINARNPQVGDTGQKVLNSSFSLEEQALPAGWELRLQSISLVREVSDVAETTYSFFDSVRLLFAITVPETAASGTYDLAATVQRRTGEQQRLNLFVVVDNP